MGILRRIFGGGKPRERRDPNALYFYVRCDKCGEKIRLRVDKRYDLMRDYERGPGDVGSGYVLHRDVMGNKCFEMMHMEVFLDNGHRVLSQDITGGEFITYEEYTAEEEHSA